jgi:hypothetical protein
MSANDVHGRDRQSAPHHGRDQARQRHGAIDRADERELRQEIAEQPQRSEGVLARGVLGQGRQPQVMVVGEVEPGCGSIARRRENGPV